MAQRYGVLRQEGHSERAIFIVDPEGIIRYIDIHDIELQPDNQVLFAELARIDPDFPLDEFQPNPGGEPLPSEGLVVFCTPWCPDCRRARQWMESNQISYTEVDVSKNLDAAEQVKRWAGGNRVTPTFNFNGTVVVGWDQGKMEQMLLGK